MTVTGLQLGAPGVYPASVRQQPAFRPIRLDVAGFVGVAPRGPVDRPVAVDSWSDYTWRFGAFEGPGLLPWAVRSFFVQGGSRAYVVRVSPLPRDPAPEAVAARASHRLLLGAPPGASMPTTLEVLARDEGTWGTGLLVTCELAAGQRFVTTGRPGAGGQLLVDLPRGVEPPAGSLLRVRAVDRVTADQHWVEGMTHRDVDGRRVRVARTSPLTACAPLAAPTEVEVEVVTLAATVAASDPVATRSEVFGGLGLRADHPRYLPRVLSCESLLAEVPRPWPEALPPGYPGPGLVTSELARPGTDRWSAVGPDSLFGDVPVDALPVGGVEPVDEDLPPLHGADLLSTHPDVAMLLVPDLYWDYLQPAAQEEPAPRERAPEFRPCPTPEPGLRYPASPPAASRLDGRSDLPEIVRRQQRLVALAEHQQRFVTLLDVPEHLTVDGVARWRSHFDSSYAAAYHPWLGVQPDSRGALAVLVPPSAAAAGIVAERERRLGLPWGPANALAVDAVTSATPVTDRELDALHALDVDVFHAERNGFRLVAAHTLASDPSYRQLSVRRLMTFLRLVLYRQSQWLTFEPHTPQLRRQLRDALVHLLRDLYRGGAFAGDTEATSFFVRCDEAVNPSWSEDLGRLVAEVGVAPAVPLEFLVLRISQDAGGSVRVEG